MGNERGFMRRSAAPLLLAILPILAAEIAQPFPAIATTLASLTVGMKHFEFWGDQPAQSLDLMWGGHGWPVLLNGFACRASGKAENAFSDTFESSSYEAGVGATRLWSLGAFHPHLGAGISRIWWKTHHLPGEDVADYTSESSGTRAWVAGGGFLPLGSGFHLGATARLSGIRQTGSLGTQIGLEVGWGSRGRR